MRLIMFFFVLYLLAFWLTNLLLYFHHMSLSYRSVVDYYLGSEERFLQPKSYQGLLEITHMHLFAFGLLLVTLTHLLLFIPVSNQVKILLTLVSFLAGLAEIGAGWLVRYVSPAFAYLKILGFLLVQTVLLVLIVAIIVVLVKASKLNFPGTKKR